MDFDLEKRLTNLRALARIGYAANRRLLRVQRLSHDPIIGTQALHTVCDPVRHPDGRHVAGLGFTDPRAQALLHIVLIFRLQPNGFTNRDLRALLADHLARPAAGIIAGQATYDLHRLREHGLITRLPHTHRYQVTDTGLANAMFLTHAHDRFVRAGLALLHDPHHQRPLRAATRAYQAAVDTLAQQATIAA